MNTQKNIVLIGFMGAGKSTVAALLAKQLGRPVVSTDDLIVAAEKRAITDIFRDSGEAYFREVEKKVVREIAQQQGIIIDCGGGVVLNSENIANLKINGVLFYLRATAEEIFKRVKAERHRPLLNTDDPLAKIRDLLSLRAPFYAQADHQVGTNGKSPDAICSAIVKIMSSH